MKVDRRFRGLDGDQLRTFSEDFELGVLVKKLSLRQKVYGQPVELRRTLFILTVF